MKPSRRDFIEIMAAAGIGSSIPAIYSSSGWRNESGKSPLKLGLASYTLRTLSLDQTIETTARLDLTYLALKSMHMPLDAGHDTLGEIHNQIEQRGIELYGAGVIYMKSAAEVQKAFDYARAAGLKVIIGVPNHELLPQVEQLVKQTGIKVAIHNHGPGDLLYSSCNDVYDKVKDLDSRVGFCIDIGHVVRINEDPVEMILKYQDRLYDIHLKDVDKAQAEGKSVEFGRGIIDFPSVFKALSSINYEGVMAIEFEKDEDDPVPGLAECVGYARGLMKLLD